MKQRDREGGLKPGIQTSVTVHLHLHPAFHFVSERTNKNKLLGEKKRFYSLFFPTFLNFLPQPFERLE